MTTQTLIKALKSIGEHSVLTLYSDGSGLVNFDFTDKSSDREVAFFDEKHLASILKINDN